MFDQEVPNVHNEVHIHNADPQIKELLHVILQEIRTLQHMEMNEMADLQALATEVEAITDVENAVEIVLGRLADQIERAGVDQAQLDDLVSKLRTERTDLAAAVVAYTPAEPAPTPEPAPAPEPVPADQPNVPVADTPIAEVADGSAPA
jgi:vacuolar-type H+-ATPase subunit I/STV1